MFVFVALALLAACGGAPALAPTSAPVTAVVEQPTGLPTTEATVVTTSEPAAAIIDATATASTPEGAIVIDHPKGQLRLDAPATRVLACSDEVVDMVLALGVQPAGVCSARVQNVTQGNTFAPASYFFEPAQYGAPVFVGSSLEPSLEQIATLKPDLIIAMSDSDATQEQMAQIAPVLYVDADSPAYWRDTLGDVGRALGREAEAAAFLERYDQRVESIKGELAPVVAAQPNALVIYSFSPDPQMMIFRRGSWLSKGLEQLGFTAVEPADVEFPPAGWAIVSTEYLTKVEADLIIVLRPVDAEGNVPRYPVDDLLDQLTDVRVVQQPLDPTRPSSAPLTDLFVIEQYAELLPTSAAQ
jgi:ABC-type Fe3+-hydroxamate transport system substrate-binding protein